MFSRSREHGNVECIVAIRHARSVIRMLRWRRQFLSFTRESIVRVQLDRSRLVGFSHHFLVN